MRATLAQVGRWVRLGFLTAPEGALLMVSPRGERLRLLRHAKHEAERLLQDYTDEADGRAVWDAMEQERDDSLLSSLALTVPRRLWETDEDYVARLRGVYGSFRVRLDPVEIRPADLIVSASGPEDARTGVETNAFVTETKDVESTSVESETKPVDMVLVLRRKQKSVVNKSLNRDGFPRPTAEQFLARARALMKEGKL